MRLRNRPSEKDKGPGEGEIKRPSKSDPETDTTGRIFRDAKIKARV